MTNIRNVEVVGKTITLAERTGPDSAVIKLDDGTVIAIKTVDEYDQMLGAWSTLSIDVT